MSIFIDTLALKMGHDDARMIAHDIYALPSGASDQAIKRVFEDHELERYASRCMEACRLNCGQPELAAELNDRLRGGPNDFSKLGRDERHEAERDIELA